MIIRKAALSDMTAIKACIEVSLNATYGGLWTSEPLMAGDGDWASAWVACADDRIIGVGLSEADVVSDLWVHPAKQRLGAGTALLAALEGEIAGRGFASARLRCLEPNLKSRAFYASRGWVEMRVYRHESLPLSTVDMTKLMAGLSK